MPQLYANTDENHGYLHISGETQGTLKELKERFGNGQTR